MSTLTKILIVLLTLSSIFLCGVVVTYVTNADNYRQKHDALKADRDSLDKKVEDLAKQVNQKIAQTEQLEDRLNSKIASLEAKNSKLSNDLSDAQRQKDELLVRVNSWASIVQDFQKTNEKQGQLLNDTLDELKKVQAQQIRQKKDLDETSTTLLEKMAIIGTLENRVNRLVEEKTGLQKRYDKLLQPRGEVAAPVVPVTPERDWARPAKIETQQIALKGLVKAVDLKNRMAEISLGKVDGIKEGMKFYITRGDEFVCELLIIDIDTDKSVGVMERVQYQPKTGDTVSTSL
ncbi:MAG: hypothetical protein JXB29_05345 [Sedimentisphaerales bacterium]|nr:hypothetical protein [Sedimentisphaerales bacterium]